MKPLMVVTPMKIIGICTLKSCRAATLLWKGEYTWAQELKARSACEQLYKVFAQLGLGLVALLV